MKSEREKKKVAGATVETSLKGERQKENPEVSAPDSCDCWDKRKQNNTLKRDIGKVFINNRMHTKIHTEPDIQMDI